MLVASFQEQVDRALSIREEVAVKQNEIARAFDETLGAERLIVKVEKPAAERAQATQELIDLNVL